VATQVAQGAEFIKMIGSAPKTGLSQEAQTAVVQAAHDNQQQVILHTSSYSSWEQGLIAGADQIHHSTLDMEIDDRLLDMFLQRGRTIVACLTLTMMKAIADNPLTSNTSSFASAFGSVRKLVAADVQVIAGTDGNMQTGAPGQVPFGSSLHDELDFLVQAGMNPVMALNAATRLPAEILGLSDRGAIQEGLLADTILVDGDPTEMLALLGTLSRFGLWVLSSPMIMVTTRSDICSCSNSALALCQASINEKLSPRLGSDGYNFGGKGAGSFFLPNVLF
jgi:imidazolonepropionase-like amidohydrolase